MSALCFKQDDPISWYQEHVLDLFEKLINPFYKTVNGEFIVKQEKMGLQFQI